MPSPGRLAAAPARPWHIPSAAAPPPTYFLHAVPHAQNILCKAVCCSILSCFSHMDPRLFPAPTKLWGEKKFCFYSFPKNLFLLSVSCYARRLLSDWCSSEYTLYFLSLCTTLSKLVCASSQNLLVLFWFVTHPPSWHCNWSELFRAGTLCFHFHYRKITKFSMTIK